MTSDNALRLENIPTIGPLGLSTNMPDRVHPITNADVYEVLRWMHADLKRIHRAFHHVDAVRRDLEATRLLYHKQATASLRSIAQHEGIAGRLAEVESQVSRHSLALDNMASQNVRSLDAMGTLASSIDTLTQQLARPWWKRLIGRTI